MKLVKKLTRSAANKAGSGRGQKVTDHIPAGGKCETSAVSQMSAEPDIAAEAPEAAVHNVSGAKEANDGVEFPEAVLLVGKTHWRCVTCMVLYPRTNSVDEHLNTHHRQPNFSLDVPSAPKRRRGSRRRANLDKAASQASKVSEPEIRQKALRSAVHPVEDVTEQKAANKKETTRSSTRLQGRGRMKGGRGTRRVGGWQRKGRMFTKPLTNEDSDTEIEASASSPPLSVVPGKRKAQKPVSAAYDAQDLTDNTQLHTDLSHMTSAESPPASKKAKTGENDEGCDITSPYEAVGQSLPTSCEKVPRDTFKDLMKVKYVVFVGKGGTGDYPLDSEIPVDIDPPLPIETPSLQADAFLPPATPLLPDIHGPPETPILPETPHPPKVPHQSDPFHQSEPSGVDCQVSTHPELLSPVAPGTVSVTEADQLSKPEKGVCAEHHLMGDYFSSDGMMTSKSSDKEFVSASVCMTCGAAFDSPDELRLHREEMVKFDIVSCNSCGDKFHGLHQLNIHVFTTHEKFTKKFCFLCDVDCLDGFELQEHLLEHTSVETDGEEDINDLDSVQHTCKTCGMEVEGNLSDLMNHYHTTHDQFICTKCYELFIDMTEYEDHKMLHFSHADVAVVYSCPVSDCFQMCEDKEALMDHISWHEDRDIDEEQQSHLQCHYCSDYFRNIISLQRHLADTHNEPDLRPFVCELCRAGFSHSLELHQHNAIRHTGIKRYGCAYCSQRFAFRSAHRRHVASEHDVAATVLRM